MKKLQKITNNMFYLGMVNIVLNIVLFTINHVIGFGIMALSNAFFVYYIYKGMNIHNEQLKDYCELVANYESLAKRHTALIKRVTPK